jgi:hypothetical protein
VDKGNKEHLPEKIIMNDSCRSFGIAAFITLTLIACAMATKQRSAFDTNNVLQDYTPGMINAIEQNFDANPLQYSQDMGNLLLWQMHQKSPEFALEFAQTPELNDGIDAKEAKAMLDIYNLIKDQDFPPSLFVADDKPREIILEWQGNSEKKSDWKGLFYKLTASDFVRAEPIGFEPEDQLYYVTMTNGERDLRWKSWVDSGDKDGLRLALLVPGSTRIALDINKELIFFRLNDVLANKPLLFTPEDGLEGTLTISSAYETGVTPEQVAIREMVRAGEGDYKFSSAMQALLWGYMDGHFKDNPLKSYTTALEFVKPIWGDMEGPRWDDFDEVTLRLNTPELLDYWERRNLTYEYYWARGKSVQAVFKSKRANCYDTAEFTRYCLSKAGYRSGNILVALGEGHNICYYWVGKDLFLMDNARKRGITGPYKGLGEIPYIIIQRVF